MSQKRCERCATPFEASTIDERRRAPWAPATYMTSDAERYCWSCVVLCGAERRRRDADTRHEQDVERIRVAKEQTDTAEHATRVSLGERDEARKECEWLKGRVEAAADNREGWRKEKAQLQAKVGRLQDAKRIVIHNLKSCMKGRVLLHERLEKAAARYNDVMKLRDALSKELGKTKAERDEARGNLQRMMVERDKAKDAANDASAAYTVASAERGKLSGEIDHEKGLRVQAMRMLATRDTELAMAISWQDSLVGEVAEIRGGASAAANIGDVRSIGTLDATVRALEDAEALRAACVQLETERDAVRISRDEALGRGDGFANEIARLSSELRKCNERAAEHAATVKGLEEVRDALRFDVRRFKGGLSGARIEATEAKNQRDIALGERDTARDELRVEKMNTAPTPFIQGELDRAFLSADKLQGERNQLQEERNDLKRSLEASQERCASIDARLKSYCDEVTEAVRKLEHS